MESEKTAEYSASLYCDSYGCDQFAEQLLERPAGDGDVLTISVCNPCAKRITRSRD